MYDVYEVPFYHNGEVVFKERNGRMVCVGFKSEDTGRTYSLQRIEPEAFLYINDLFNSGDLEVDGNHYVEDVTITHEVSGDVDSDGYATACWFDGKPVSDYQMTRAFRDAIEDVVEQEHMNAREHY